MQRDSLICGSWLVNICDMTPVDSACWPMTIVFLGHDSFIRVTCYIHKCVTNLVHMCGMTRSYVWHVLFICETQLIYTCDTAHSNVWHDSLMCVLVPAEQFIRVTWLTHVCDLWTPLICARDSVNVCASVRERETVRERESPEKVFVCEWGKQRKEEREQKRENERETERERERKLMSRSSRRLRMNAVMYIFMGYVCMYTYICIHKIGRASCRERV